MVIALNRFQYCHFLLVVKKENYKNLLKQNLRHTMDAHPFHNRKSMLSKVKSEIYLRQQYTALNASAIRKQRKTTL
jgi:hypothetical protein